MSMETIIKGGTTMEKDINNAMDIRPYQVESEITSVESKKTTLTGVVCNCGRLNVRKRPSKKSEVLEVINKGALLIIETPNKDKPTWYKVTTEKGTVGHCMAEFIELD